ncbi:MAG: hypothetical protein H0Z38_00780 [Firmicutes bacterium]|nr:hypothetical protein [Bacillota bacterium]
MPLYRRLLGLIKKGLTSNKQPQHREPGTYVPKRFPFLWLSLVLALSLPVQASRPIIIQLEGGPRDRFIETAKTNLYSLPAAVVKYTTYPVMLRLKNLNLGDVQVSAELQSGLIGPNGNQLPGARLDWVQGSWIWEGREDEGPAPGIQFTAMVPLLTPPGQYQAEVLVRFYTDGELAGTITVTLALEVPRWAACLNSPLELKVRKKSLGEPGRAYLESDNLVFLIAANTNWSLWLNSELFSSAKLVGTGGSTLTLTSGYTSLTTKITAPWPAPQGEPASKETTLDIILKF